jgi:glutaminyl-peptide cyclotransferase
MKKNILILLVAVFIGGFIYKLIIDNKKPEESTTPTTLNTVGNLNTTAISSKAYDATNYTEGLEFYDGKLYASSGKDNISFIAFYDTATGKQLKKQTVPVVFGEGLSILNNTLYLLTYKNKKVLLFDAKTLAPKGELAWKYGDGWGLTNNGTELIASNGTNELYYLNPTNMEATKRLMVTANDILVNQINELEYVDGYIYANQFTTDHIYKIDANTGKVVAQGNFSNLLPEFNAKATEAKTGDAAEYYFNGIAYNKERKTFFVTGKNWPKIFEVKF